MILAAFVVLSLGAVTQLTAASEDEIRNQADCVSFRPPPPECQIPTVETTTTIGGGPGTTSPPTSVVPPSADPAFADPRSEATAANWAALVDVSVTSGGSPVAGVEIRVRVQMTQPSSGQPFFLSCTTDASGTCTIRFDVPTVGATEVTITVEDVFPPDERPIGVLPDPVAIASP